MIIGAIEYCSRQEVSGWIYSPYSELKGKPVLAFLNGACVGAGEIGNFRQDLADAGVGDGHYGYHFWITLPADADSKAVVITLQECEAFLKQRDAVIGVVHREDRPALCGHLPASPRIDWMQDKGLVGDSEAASLRSLLAFGVSQHLNPPDEETAPRVRAFLEAIEIGPIGVSYIDIVTGPNFRDELLAHAETQNAGVFVLQAATRCNFLVRESAGVAAQAGMEGGASATMADFGAVAYFCDANTALVLRRGTPFKVKPAMMSETVRCYFPVPLDANSGDTAVLRGVDAGTQMQDSVLK